VPEIFKPPSAALFPASKLATLLESPDCVIAVAEIDGKVVGHIYGAIVRRADNEFTKAEAHMYIQQIGIDESERRQGIGTALVNFVFVRARAMGVAAVQVDHWAFNARARAFFESCGFVPVKITMRQPVNDIQQG
jgi:ribosomal protein S18 acetylase RimI-like enzyme